MKLHNLFAGLLLATSASLSAGALAADGDKPAADAPGEKATMPAKKKMKPHSHMEEKGGMAPASTSADADKKTDTPTSDKPRADKDKSKHLHPRDGK
ncbi:hypothetical protein [Denitratisoma oestradiolicum]|uniref:Pentapeptide MXKDX repeat protein n=1 Tax=Denitratisoma oestradiolicum TaxID=311182 RepID=A0A6S6XSR4_9PROT|nr:hypothetical protein [Denitratisoma oestradiolicum]TWO82103.1 hypothetical protein CBW56_01290 [Denitratisoma oestradiolicum]CAB1369033.1 conserved exported protein of unknown function [Denitratisoma oestradiolicum]